MMKYCIFILSLLIVAVYSIPLEYEILNSKLKRVHYSCDTCDNFLDGVKNEVIACAYSYITNTNEKGYLGFTPLTENIDSDEYDCAPFKIKLNPVNGLYEDDETKVVFSKNQLTMIIKDPMNDDCKCEFNYVISYE